MKVLSVLSLALLFSACSHSPSRTTSMKASLRLGWIPSATFSGEVAGMRLFAKQHGLEVEIRPGGASLNTVTLVASGQDTFGTLAADEVLLANENGADLTIVGVINDVSPGGFVALKKSGIRSPRDFPGHKIGVLPFGSTTLLYEAMLAANGVDRSTIHEVTISPDLRPFIQGVYDVQPVFAYDETVTLDRQGIQYTLIEPKAFGVQLKGPVYFTRRSTVENHPELVDAFIRTVVEGWNYAINKPDEAIRMLKDFAPDVDADRERTVL